MTFESFDSLGEMFAAIEQQNKAARERLAALPPWVRNLRAGDYVIADRTQEYGLVIYGEIQPLDEPLDDLFLWGRWYSAACDDGELGTSYRETMTARITADQFEAFRQLGWPSDIGFVGALLAATVGPEATPS